MLERWRVLGVSAWRQWAALAYAYAAPALLSPPCAAVGRRVGGGARVLAGHVDGVAQGEGIQTMCGHTPFCPDPLVYLSNGERQPYASGNYVINLRPLESRQVDIRFNTGAEPLALPADLPLEILSVERQWYDQCYGPLSYRQFYGGLLYEDHELTITAPNAPGKVPTVGYFPVTVTAKRQLSQGRSVVTFRVQKPGTRWGSSGQVSLTVWTHKGPE
ncbi:hypothetical protein ACFP81_04785 [Deinococcus lacus]|uniref:Uncharacterized protein n=1 Tax=Deinococcus lacus TaxID=392561 RepID=A0ABW1YEU8_9DEIO